MIYRKKIEVRQERWSK